MFDENDELADDEEEILVYVEFDGSVAGNTFSNEKLTLDMIGLDKEHPIMQVNGKYYEGTYQDAIGTYMFFEKDKNPPVDDPVFDAIPTLKYCAKTRKILKMQRIFVEPKTEMFGDSNDQNCIPNMKIISEAGIPPKYQEAALKSWENMRNDRMEALNKYLEKQRIREEKRSRGIEPDSESDDDNPFVMYKPETRQKKTKEIPNDLHASTEKLGNSVENETVETDSHLTVIDPGPSTSKDSQPWNHPLATLSEQQRTASKIDDDTYRVNLPNVTGKHRATVKVMRKGKIRKYSRLASKKIDKKDEQSRKSDDSEDVDDLSLMEESDNRLDDSFTNDTVDSLENANDETSGNEKLTTSTEVDPGDESESTNDKRKIEKQQKRDEKMRLISERLKKAAEELSLKTNQRSDSKT